MYDPDLSIKDLMENEFLKEMFMYVCMAGAFALSIIVMLLLQFVPSLKNKVKAKLIAIKDKTLWNGIIRSQMISFLPTAMTVYTMHKSGQHDQASGFAAFCAIWTVGTFVFVTVNRDKLDTKEYRAKYDKLYEGVDVSLKSSISWRRDVIK